MAPSRHAPPKASAAAAALEVETRRSRQALLTATTAVAIALALWASGAWAQDAQEQGTEQAQEAQPSDETGQAAGGEQASGDAADALVATLGDAEIRTSDLRRAIGQLPQPLSAQPPELVASAALQQLLLREAILQQARSAGLAQDPEVQSLVTAAAQSAEEDALVQVWLERELEARVPAQSVDQAYAALGAITTGDLPPLEQVRPQIEENLRRQAIEELQATLLTGADLTFYGPDSQPRAAGARAGEAQDSGAGRQDGTGGQPPQDQPNRTTEGDQSGGAAVDPGQAQDGAAADQGTAGGQPTQEGN